MGIYKDIMRKLMSISYQLKCLNENIEQLIRYMTKPVTIEQEKKKILLGLPSHLVKTYFTLETLEKGSAQEVSLITHKQRAVESGFLNQLCNLGLITKRRKGRMVIFEVKKQ